MAVPMTLSDIEEYSLTSIAVGGGNMQSQSTVGNVTLPKAVLSIVKIFAVYTAQISKTSNLLWQKHHNLDCTTTDFDIVLIVLLLRGKL